jgi:hypothetical protein
MVHLLTPVQVDGRARSSVVKNFANENVFRWETEPGPGESAKLSVSRRSVCYATGLRTPIKT